MQLPEELRGPRAISIGLGLLGAAFALSVVKSLTPMQKVAMIAAGPVAAALFAPPIITLVNAPDGWGNAISFTVGAIGWISFDALVAMIRKADLWSLTSDIIRSWLQRR